MADDSDEAVSDLGNRKEQMNSQFPVGFKKMLRILSSEEGITMSKFIVKAVINTRHAKAYIALNPDECPFANQNS